MRNNGEYKNTRDQSELFCFRISFHRNDTLLKEKEEEIAKYTQM